MSLKTKKAARANAFGELCRVTGCAGKRGGLKSNFKGSACNRRRARAMMPKPRAIAGSRRRGLKLGRRTIAAPLRGVFLMAIVCRTYGVIASAFCTGAPCGTPSGVLFPIEQSANPHGVAHPRRGVVNGSQNVSIGA